MMFSWPFVIRPAAAGHCSVWGGDVSIVTPILVIYSTRPNLEWDGVGQETLTITSRSVLLLISDIFF